MQTKRTVIPTLTRAALALVFTAAAGCDCGGRTTAVLPMLELAPEAVAFGKVSVGGSSEQLVDLRNSGRGGLEIQSITVTTPAKGEGGVDEVAVAKLLATDCSGNPRDAAATTIAGGECARFAVRYVPTKIQKIAAVVTIVSNDLDRPTLEVPVTGEGISATVRLCALNAAGDEEEGACTHFDSPDPAVAAKLPEVAFGAAPVRDIVLRKVRVHNDGEGDLVVSSVTVTSDSPDFSVEGAPISVTVPGGKSADVTAKFQPTGDGPEAGKLVFATNDLAHPTVELPMTAEAQGPRLCILPADGLDFGAIPMNSSRKLSVNLKNCGYAPYSVTSFDFVEDGFATPTNFVVTAPNTIPAMPRPLLPGDSFDVDLTYTPRAVASHTGYFTVVTEFQRGRIPVKGAGSATCGGSDRPTAIVKVKKGTVDITATAGTTGVEPLTSVTFDGSTSLFPRAGSAADKKYKWRLVSQPTNGTQNIAPSAATPSKASLYAELDGDYVVELVTSDQYGCDSAPVQTKLHVASTGKVHVQLTWPESYGDIDLHFLGPGGSMDSSSDCYYGNCKPVLHSLDWGRNNTTVADGRSDNDPTLDVDELWGHGPENTTHDLPFDASYEVVVHYYCHTDDNGNSPSPDTVRANVKIFVNGQPVGQTYVQPMREGDKWRVARITVSGNGQSVNVAPVSGTAVTNIGAGSACRLF